MLLKNVSILFACTMLCAPVLAAQQSPTHTIVTKDCFIRPLKIQPVARHEDYVLLRMDEKEIQMLAETKTDRKDPCGGFLDVTKDWNDFNAKHPDQNNPKAFLKAFTEPSHSIFPAMVDDDPIKYPKQVNAVVNRLNPEKMWQYLTKFSSFKDRYANSNDGVKAADWLKTKVETIAKNAGRNDVTVYTIATGSYQQPSVVAKVGNSTEPGVVIGGHMDTLSSRYENKPGADDDGTGTVTVLDTARAIITSGIQFKKPIYFIWYAAEELGLVGSGYVVRDFRDKKIPVAAVMQLDMTGYAYNNDLTMWLINDNVNQNLTSYVAKLISNYVKRPLRYTTCGYACSDHASWHRYGYAAVTPFESALATSNPHIHTSRDTMEKLSLDHMNDYAKLAAAFAVEQAEPINA